MLPGARKIPPRTPKVSPRQNAPDGENDRNGAWINAAGGKTAEEAIRKVLSAAGIAGAASTKKREEEPGDAEQ